MKNLRLIFCFLLIFIMTGCGKSAELENYKANMNQFFENIKIFDSSINALAGNPESEIAVSDLLALLDSMDTSFQQMASLEVPDGFPGVADLASEASEYMSEAVSLYHQAYEGESFNASLEDAARQNYECANIRLQYIISILHGNIPEEIFTYEDDDTAAGETGTEAPEDTGSAEDMSAPEDSSGEDSSGEDSSGEESFVEDPPGSEDAE